MIRGVINRLFFVQQLHDMATALRVSKVGDKSYSLSIDFLELMDDFKDKRSVSVKSMQLKPDFNNISDTFPSFINKHRKFHLLISEKINRYRSFQSFSLPSLFYFFATGPKMLENTLRNIYRWSQSVHAESWYSPRYVAINLVHQ